MAFEITNLLIYLLTHQVNLEIENDYSMFTVDYVYWLCKEQC